MSTLYSASDCERWVKEEHKNASRTDFGRDRDRLLHSSALRRLGAKTQVLGPESDDFVRTRLTHSLEVAQIGRSLAMNFSVNPDIVETACLAHDIGHPPFGHNGERALADIAESIGGFEGNAQTFRLLTRLEPKIVSPSGRHIGLNLTRATLDATIKYPWDFYHRPEKDGVRTHKFNVYEDDREIFSWVRENRGNDKCVESQIMDLADDIAYSVHDVEDAIVRGAFYPEYIKNDANRELIFSMVKKWYKYDHTDILNEACDRLFHEENWPQDFSSSYCGLASIKNLTSDVIGRFISSVTNATKEHYGDVSFVRYGGNIIIPEQTRAEILVLKGIAVAYVMEPRLHTPDLDYQRSLLFDLVEVLDNKPNKLEPHFYDMWIQLDEKYKLRAIIDQVASLTDQSARSWHARLCGMLRH